MSFMSFIISKAEKGDPYPPPPPPRAVLLGNVGKRTFPKKLGNGNVGKRETLAFLCWKRYETWFWET